MKAVFGLRPKTGKELSKRKSAKSFQKEKLQKAFTKNIQFVSRYGLAKFSKNNVAGKFNRHILPFGINLTIPMINIVAEYTQ